jgi:hypothetical protein
MWDVGRALSTPEHISKPQTAPGISRLGIKSLTSRKRAQKRQFWPLKKNEALNFDATAGAFSSDGLQTLAHRGMRDQRHFRASACAWRQLDPSSTPDLGSRGPARAAPCVCSVQIPPGCTQLGLAANWDIPFRAFNTHPLKPPLRKSTTSPPCVVQQATAISAHPSDPHCTNRAPPDGPPS